MNAKLLQFGATPEQLDGLLCDLRDKRRRDVPST
jgi:hypothetical protein